MSDRALGVALQALGALIDAGVPAADALSAVAARFPSGADRDGWVRAAARVADGADPAEALAAALPTLRPHLRPGPDLPARLACVGRAQLDDWRLRRRLALAAAYPVRVAWGLVLVTGAIVVAALQRPEPVGGVASTGLGLALAGLALGVGLLWTTRRAGDAGARWARVLPGGQVWGLARRARAARAYALGRDPAGGDRAPAELTGQPETTPLPAMLAAAFDAEDAAELALGERAGRPAAVAAALAGRLERSAAAHTERLATAAGTALLVVAGLGVLLLLMGLYPELMGAVGRWAE
ncbi:MAG: type II secretion system F family protein [Myxococcales bacterium]|nr:type II secretion system F family protein [Myxococcales bacterium]